jgi:methionine salvage enolase-phosphatase E1
MSPELRAILMHDEKIQEVQKEVSEVKEDLNDFKDDIPLFTVECEEISKAVKRIGTKALGGKVSKAYSNKSLRAKVYSDIHRQLKREFDVNSYKAIKRRYLSDALDIVDEYNLTIALKEQISMLNEYISFA